MFDATEKMKFEDGLIEQFADVLTNGPMERSVLTKVADGWYVFCMTVK